MKCSAASIRKRIERLEQAQAQRAAMERKAAATRADVQLTDTERYTAFVAMFGTEILEGRTWAEFCEAYRIEKLEQSGT